MLSPWTLCAYKVASPHLSHNQYWPWPRGYWAAHRSSLLREQILESPAARMYHPWSPTTVHQRMLLPETTMLCRSWTSLGPFHPAALWKTVQLHLSIQQINPKQLQLHSLILSLMSRTSWVYAVPVTVMPAHLGQHQGHYLALMSSCSSQGLSTNCPIQWGCHQRWAPCHLLGCH